MQLVSDEQIVAFIDNVDPEDVHRYADPTCPYCRGTSVIPGAWVPYGMPSSVQLPDITCECVYEYGVDKVRRDVEEGEIEL